MTLDSETKAVELPEDHGDELRLWLRLLTCTNLIEGEVRSRLRERFDVTLPRFDLMAQLDKAPDGMTLSDVSKRMMVSNGNVTGLVERLVESGHLDRRTSDVDRRVQVIRLTKSGRAEFLPVAEKLVEADVSHPAEIGEAAGAFGDPLVPKLAQTSKEDVDGGSVGQRQLELTLAQERLHDGHCADRDVHH